MTSDQAKNAGSKAEAKRKHSGSKTEALRKRKTGFSSKKTNHSASAARKKIIAKLQMANV